MHIVALGSSFAAGPRIPPIVDQAAQRSGNNYPSILARQLNAKMTDLTVSGATLLNLISEPQGTFPPQAPNVPADADLVLITAGGNDIGYIGGIRWDAEAKSWIGWAYLILVSLWTGTVVPASDEKVVERYGTTIKLIRQRAPKARILLVQYLTLLGDDARPSSELPLTPEEMQKHRAVAERVDANFIRAGTEHGVEVILVAKASRGHGIGSEQPWVTGNIPAFTLGDAPASLHPNEQGMRAVAEIIARYLNARPI